MAEAALDAIQLLISVQRAATVSVERVGTGKVVYEQLEVMARVEKMMLLTVSVNLVLLGGH